MDVLPQNKNINFQKKRQKALSIYQGLTDNLLYLKRFSISTKVAM